MATVDPKPSPPSSGTHRSRVWLWVSLVLAVAAVALLAWGIKTKSDLDTADQKNEQLQAQVEQSAKSGDAALTAVKSAFATLAAQVGATNADLAAAKQQVTQAKDAGTQALKDASTSAQAAVQAKTQSAKAKAEAAKVDAQQRLANSNATLAAGCARAYLATFGSLFGGDSVRAQLPTVIAQVKSLTADCKAALSGS